MSNDETYEQLTLLWEDKSKFSPQRVPGILRIPDVTDFATLLGLNEKLPHPHDRLHLHANEFRGRRPNLVIAVKGYRHPKEKPNGYSGPRNIDNFTGEVVLGPYPLTFGTVTSWVFCPPRTAKE